jgi:ADP-ribosylglycohydrolase
LFYRADPPKAIAAAGDSSRTTHGVAAAVDACRYFALLILRALDGRSKDEIFAGAADRESLLGNPPLAPEIARLAGRRPGELAEADVRGTGYVVQSLEAALWAFDTTDDFRTGALRAVNLGDDADTTAAVYGQLAGAFYGEDGIPAEWRARLAMLPLIQETADRLFHAASRQTPA